MRVACSPALKPQSECYGGKYGSARRQGASTELPAVPSAVGSHKPPRRCHARLRRSVLPSLRLIVVPAAGFSFHRS